MITRLTLEELKAFPLYETAQAKSMYAKLFALYRKDSDALGLVTLDNYDKDYSIVCLRRKPGKEFRAVDMGASYRSADEAEEALREMLEGPSGTGPLTEAFIKDEENLK